MIKSKSQYSYLPILCSLLLTITPGQRLQAKAVPLDDAKVLGLLLKNSDVLLTTSKHCKNASAQFGAKTIADYLAGHWVGQKNSAVKNWLEVSASIVRKNHQYTGWTARVLIYQEAEEEEGGKKWLHRYGNGVEFLIKGDLVVDRGSFVCIGTD